MHHPGNPYAPGGFFYRGPPWYQSAYTEPYTVCFTDCVDRGYSPASCRGRCNARASGIADVPAGPTWLPWVIALGAGVLFFSTLRLGKPRRRRNPAPRSRIKRRREARDAARVVVAVEREPTGRWTWRVVDSAGQSQERVQQAVRQAIAMYRQHV